MRLEQRAAEADQIIEYLKQQIQLLKEKTGKIWKTIVSFAYLSRALRGTSAKETQLSFL